MPAYLKNSYTRINAADFAGRTITLSDNPLYWRQIQNAPAAQNTKDILLLGTGPGDLLNLPFVQKALAAGGSVYWLDSARMPAIYKNHFVATHDSHKIINVKTQETENLAKACHCYFYTPGKRIDPDFWGAILARLDIARHDMSDFSTRGSVAQDKFVWLPGSNNQLLHQELKYSLQKIGYNFCEAIPQAATSSALLPCWQNHFPQAVISVNLRGLDPEGMIFHLCEELGIPVAIWLVDNPWNILSALKLPWWQKAHLYITDQSFKGELVKSGCAHVRYLPLAASWHMLANRELSPSSPPLFVGRTAFPGKDSFFRGVKLEPELEKTAFALLASAKKAGLPDYHWWVRKCGAGLWPKDNRRVAALGADTVSARNRLLWIKSALKSGLKVIGDTGWRGLIPDDRLLPPVDYYGSLPALYGNASAILNITSLLMPGSLNQRHFDVWAAGGLMLGEYTTGLELFPSELTENIALHSPEDFNARLSFFNENQTERNSLIAAWREHITKKHLYEHRLTQILEDIMN